MQNKMEGKVESLQKEQIVQIGFLVKDIRKTAKKWAEFLGVEMPEISMTGKYEETHAVYRGEPCNGQIYQVCFDLANIQIEFIEPIGEEPSYWKEFWIGTGKDCIILHSVQRAVKRILLIWKARDIRLYSRESGKKNRRTAAMHILICRTV